MKQHGNLSVKEDLCERAKKMNTYTKEQYPHWSGCRDKRGLPICMFDVACLNRETIADYKKTRDMPLSTGALLKTPAKPNSVQRAIAFHETLTRFVLPLCTWMRDRPDPHIPVTSAVYLVDVSSFGLKQAFELRNYAQDISKLLATSFPEVVDTVYVSATINPQNPIAIHSDTQSQGPRRPFLLRHNLELTEKMGGSANSRETCYIN
jgi:hypothetical protein